MPSKLDTCSKFEKQIAPKKLDCAVNSTSHKDKRPFTEKNTHYCATDEHSGAIPLRIARHSASPSRFLAIFALFRARAA